MFDKSPRFMGSIKADRKTTISDPLPSDMMGFTQIGSLPYMTNQRLPNQQTR